MTERRACTIGIGQRTQHCCRRRALHDWRIQRGEVVCRKLHGVMTLVAREMFHIHMEVMLTRYETVVFARAECMARRTLSVHIDEP